MPHTATVVDDGSPSPAQGPTRTGLTTIGAAAILIVAVLVTYGRSAGSDFVFCDDNIHVFQNPYLAQWSVANLSYLWTHSYEKLYIPVSYTVFAMLAQVGRMQHLDSTITDLQTLLNPHPFHIANIVLHLLNTLLAFAILRRLTLGANGPSLVGALLFALHPVQVESVAWVSELRGLLCSFFCLAAICLYLRAVSDLSGRNEVPLRSPYYWLSVALTVVGLLSKPSAAALPLALFVLDRWSIGRPPRACAMSVLPYILIVVPIIAITNGMQHLLSISGSIALTLMLC
jgi:protein O-mannosyl-transferase